MFATTSNVGAKEISKRKKGCMMGHEYRTLHSWEEIIKGEEY